MSRLAVIETVAVIENMLRDPRVWRGRRVEQQVPCASTGHAALDEALPHGGWTLGTLNEVLFEMDGIGELELVLPVLSELTRQQCHVVVVAAPYVLYAPALRARGVQLDYLHCVDAASEIEALWAAEQCLRSGVCAAVLCWPRQAHEPALRRLQVAAETGHALGFAFRPARAALNPSPAATRIRLPMHDAGTRLDVIKCRGGLAPSRPIPFRASSTSA